LGLAPTPTFRLISLRDKKSQKKKKKKLYINNEIYIYMHVYIYDMVFLTSSSWYSRAMRDN